MYNVIRRPTNILVKPGDCPWQLQCLVIIVFFSSQTIFSGQTWNMYRYGPLVDLSTVTHFQRPWPTFQGHRPIFLPENRKIKIHITLSFMIGFWWSFVGMDPHRTPSCWPTFRYLDLLLQIKLDIDPKFCVFGLAKSTRRRIIPTTGLDAYW